MSNVVQLEVDELSMMWKVDARVDRKASCDFPFNGAMWRLESGHDEGGDLYLRLEKVSGHSLRPFKSTVQVVEGGATGGRIAADLSAETCFTFTSTSASRRIWGRAWAEILRAVPQFSGSGILRMQVELKLVEVNPRAASAACQTDCSIPELFEMSCMESLSADFDRLLMVQGPPTPPDVVFRCAGGQCVGAHKATLLARSPVIASMLMDEGGSDEVVEIPDVEPDVFRHFLRYMYYGRLAELPTVDLALSLYELGDRYAVHALVSRCSRYLVEHLSVRNACDLLVVADAHRDGDFAEKVVAYMAEAAVPEVSGDRWSAFSGDHPLLATVVNTRLWLQRARRITRFLLSTLATILSRPYMLLRRSVALMIEYP